jgi:hypothetical protein
MRRMILATVTVAILSGCMWAQAQGAQGSTTSPAHSKKSGGKSGAKHHHHKHHHKK